MPARPSICRSLWPTHYATNGVSSVPKPGSRRSQSISSGSCRTSPVDANSLNSDLNTYTDDVAVFIDPRSGVADSVRGLKEIFNAALKPVRQHAAVPTGAPMSRTTATACLTAATILSSPAWAQTAPGAAEPAPVAVTDSFSLEASTGLDYSVGKYGGTTDTTV